MKELLTIWLATGLALTFTYLCVCYLIRKGTFGRVLADDFNTQPRMEIRIPVTTIVGIVFPPAILAILVHFANKVTRNRGRL